MLYTLAKEGKKQKKCFKITSVHATGYCSTILLLGWKIIQFEQVACPFFSLAISLPSCRPVFQLLCILELLHQVINNLIDNVKKFFRITLVDS